MDETNADDLGDDRPSSELVGDESTPVEGRADIAEDDTSGDTKSTSSDRHKSDIFFLDVGGESTQADDIALLHRQETPPPRRLNKLRDHASSIFPAGCMGCREDPPSDHVTSPRRFLDAKEAKDYAGHIDNTPRKRPSSAKPTSARNPLTGVGMVAEEVKKCSTRRKDGNPLLGEGYESKGVTPSTTRIPPGGYSQGLW